MPNEATENIKVTNALIRENHIDYIFEMFTLGHELSVEHLALLIKHKRIPDNVSFEKKPENLKDKINERVLNFTSDKQKKIDALIDIVTEDYIPGSHEIITDAELEQRRKDHGHIFEGRENGITKKDWLPKSTTAHEKDFIDFINSINITGFENRIHYRKLSLYCQQAYEWLQEGKDYTDFLNPDERKDYIREELRRCDENSLYFLNKYCYFKDAKSESGQMKYIASPSGEIMAYMHDCGYSTAEVKGRQIFATTTKMLLSVKDSIFKTNFFMKFITEDKEKAEEIFEDKLKTGFSFLPWWMKPRVLNERDNLFRLGHKGEKGEREGVNSFIRVVAPKRTAIAGGAPDRVNIDEAGNIPILGQMLNNQRPTMWRYNPKTGIQEFSRIISFWGTGGEMEKGGMAFEEAFMAIYNNWNDGKFVDGIVPIFYNFWARAGISQKMYDDEKEVAYSAKETERDDKVTEFHQSYPRSLADVFRTKAKTLMSGEWIERQKVRIQEANVKMKHAMIQRGYFEPVYDMNSPTDENSDVPFKIIGANFIPVEDSDPRESVKIFLHPKENWKFRYYQGTDPISTDTGISNMASVIWDKHYKCPAAIMDWRVNDTSQVFLQSMLLGIYYDVENTKYGVKELVESNVGGNYTQYKIFKGYANEMVTNYEIYPEALRNKSAKNEGIGIDNKQLRKELIINKLRELLSNYGDKIFFNQVFLQLETFVCHIGGSGASIWGPMNKKHFKDDILDALAYAYICAESCFAEREPKDMVNEKKKTEMVYELVRQKDWSLKRVAVRKSVV